MIFRAARSSGSAWLIGIAALMIGIPVLLQALTPSRSVLLVFIATGVVAVWFVLLAIWFPSMRYELQDGELLIAYGPVVQWRIPYRAIRGTRWQDLRLNLLASHRLPGFALFGVMYGGDVGVVRMCASRSLHHILLIETDHGLYGVTPADEEGFLAALKARIRV